MTGAKATGDRRLRECSCLLFSPSRLHPPFPFRLHQKLRLSRVLLSLPFWNTQQASVAHCRLFRWIEYLPKDGIGQSGFLAIQSHRFLAEIHRKRTVKNGLMLKMSRSFHVSLTSLDSTAASNAFRNRNTSIGFPAATSGGGETAQRKTNVRLQYVVHLRQNAIKVYHLSLYHGFFAQVNRFRYTTFPFCKTSTKRFWHNLQLLLGYRATH